MGHRAGSHCFWEMLLHFHSWLFSSLLRFTSTAEKLVWCSNSSILRIKMLNIKPLVLHFGFKAEIEKAIKPRMLRLWLKTTFPSTFCIYGEKKYYKAYQKKNFYTSRVRFQRTAIVSNASKYVIAQNSRMMFLKSHIKLTAKPGTVCKSHWRGKTSISPCVAFLLIYCMCLASTNFSHADYARLNYAFPTLGKCYM